MLQRVYVFLTWLIIMASVMVVGLMILRLLANVADLNPFGWSSRTIRRLTDPLIMPVRRALAGFGVDPKYAPLVTILIAILLSWFLVQLTGGIANTAAGIVFAIQRAKPIYLVGYVLYGLLGIYSLLIFIRIVFSWVMVSHRNRVMRFLFNVTEPLLGPLRRIIPPLGMFDISPIVAFIIISLLQAAVSGTLLRGAPLGFFF